MVAEVRKLHLIEKLLRITSESELVAIESFLDRSLKKENKLKPKIDDFIGILSEKEANEMKKVISETCEKIDPNDWK